MKTLVILFFSWLVAFGYARCQTIENAPLKYVEIFSTGFDGSRIAYHIQPEGRYTEIKGSPYLSDEWINGAIQLKTDSVPSPFRMRYNIYGNEMQFIYLKDTFAVSNPYKVAAVWLENRRFEYLSFVINENQQYAYFEVMVDGPYRLLKLHGARLDAGRDPVTPYHCQNSTDRFVKTESWYYQSEAMPVPEALPGSARSLSRIFQKSIPGLLEQMKTMRFRIHRETDLVRIFSWMNEQK